MKRAYKADHHKWLECLPNNLADCFEMPIKGDEPQRLTGVVFRPGKDFTKAIEDLDIPDKHIAQNHFSLNLMMAIDKKTGLFSPYFELVFLNKRTLRLSHSDYLNETVYTPTRGSALAHEGVSANYKNELCLNWGALPYYKMNEVFYAPMLYDATKLVHAIRPVTLHQPKRVRKFVIPGTDLRAMHRIFVNNNVTEIIIHFGINSIGSAQLGVPFNPVIEVDVESPKAALKAEKAKSKEVNRSFENGAPDPTFLDFVQACPPYCDPDGPGEIMPQIS